MIKRSIAIISDIHGNDLALEAVLSDISNRNVNLIFNLGDSLYGPLNPFRTAEKLMGLNITHIQGNCDRMLLDTTSHTTSATLISVKRELSKEHLSWLSQHSKTLIVEGIFLCHGTPESDEIYLLEEMSAEGGILKNITKIMESLKHIEQEVIVCGHSHIPRVVYLPDGKMVVNPGSVGLPAYMDELPIAHKMVSGTPHAKYAILEKLENEWIVEHIAVPYDWEKAANLALQNNRADWATAIKYGTI
ncbi:metallophosphoesterase family protein [Lysinibacillus sp. NPDC097287]|uniref:metallophosphoesterase family protein n=1 Tax=Lysinibacillus sp. NPDC097287 TaxID=3364144 RepID=UPI00381551D7